MATSPTQNTLKRLRKEGYTAEVVEKWIPRANVRKDLFGFIDIVALRGDETLAVQACNYSDVSKRVKKITDSEYLPTVRDAGWRIEVHGWHKPKHRFVCRVVDIS